MSNNNNEVIHQRAYKKHLEKVFYIVAGVIIATAATVIKERLFDTKDYELRAYICAPLVDVEAKWVNLTTGEEFDVPDAEGLNPIFVRFENTGKLPMEELSIVLHFEATGNFQLLDEAFATTPLQGFGTFEIVAMGETARELAIDLFNPGDKFEYIATGTRPATITASSKFPGLSYYEQQQPGCEFDT